jgi:hypothetical protein
MLHLRLQSSVRHYHWPFWVLLIAAGLVQMALFAYAAAPGLAGTSDSRFYLHAAQTLRQTGQLLNPDGTAYRFWPPLYPVLLGVCGSPAIVRVMHGACLLGSLLLWGWLGRQLLPLRRALVLPWLLALSTPWLLVSRFVWAESGFLLLFAAYAALLWQWQRTGRWQWWSMVTIVGFLLPLQRTLGLFLLAGVGAGLLVGAWRWLSARSRWQLVLHLAVSVAGGLVWQWYALLMAGPSRYHPSQGWSQLLSSGADFGFVLGRWLLPLPTAGRGLLPDALWAATLLVLFGLLWPRWSAQTSSEILPAESAGNPGHLARPLLRMLWSTAAVLVALVAGLTVFAQSAAGIHDAERYTSVLFGPVILLALVAWPTRAPRWLGQIVVAAWLLSAALRVSHVAADLHKLPPIVSESVTGPGAHQ